MAWQLLRHFDRLNETDSRVLRAFNFKRNMTIALFAQLVVLCIGVLKSVILPYAMEVSDYGYWQQYLLYAGFVGIFALGFTDGVYLLYGDRDYDELPFGKLRSAFRFFCAMLALFAVLMICYSSMLADKSRSFAMTFVSFDIFIACVSGLFIYILQITNQFLWYSICTVIDKVIFVVLACALISLGLVGFEYFVVADAACRMISLFLLCWRCRKMIFGSADSLLAGFAEFSNNIKVGINLMFANFASMLTTNLGRFIVDVFGGLSNYAFYSFGISITNLVLTFVSAASYVLYPALKRVDTAQISGHYRRLSMACFIVGGVGLCLYFPVVWGVLVFYEKYAASLSYLNILFVAAFFQAVMTLVANTFYKTLRLERRLFVVNLECVVGFSLMAAVTFYMTHDIFWIAVSTAVTAGLRCIMSEAELAKYLSVGIWPVITCQIVLVAGFVACSSAGVSAAEGLGGFAALLLILAVALQRILRRKAS